MTEAHKHRPDTGCVRTKAEGAFIALAAGDALGWPQEIHRKLIRPKNSPISENFHQWVRRGGGPFRSHEEIIGPGEYSDDTQATLAVARCRVMSSPDWWTALTRTELPLWTLYERGGGGATKRAAQSWLHGLPPWQNKKKNSAKQYFEAGGNGVTMRIVPHAIFFAGQADASEMIHDVIMDGVATHGHPRALVGATVYAYAAWWYLRAQKTIAFGEAIDVLLSNVNVWAAFPTLKYLGNEWLDEANVVFDGGYRKVWQSTVSEMQELLERVHAELKEGAIANDDAILKDLGAFGPSKGAGTVSAAAALYLTARYAAQPAQGILKAAFTHGTDTDTVASMVGGLAGCLAGTDWLPKVWLKVQDSGYLRTLANRVARGPTDTVEPSPNLTPVGAPHIEQLCRALTKGNECDLDIDGVRKARVANLLHPISLSKTTHVRTWSLHVDDGQTLYITNVSRKSNNNLRPNTNNKAPVAEHNTSDIIASVDGVKFSVCELAPAVSFYKSVFGLQPTDCAQEFVKFGILSLVKSRHIQGIRTGAKQPPTHPSENRIEICVSRLEKCLERVEKSGGRIIHEIKIPHRRQRFFQCLDIDGNRIEVIESSNQQVDVVAERNQRNAGRKTHQLRSEWTSAKLDMLAQYLTSYTTLLKNRHGSGLPSKIGYIDAFTDNNYHKIRCDPPNKKSNQGLLFPDLAKQEPQEFLNHSEELVLKAEPQFDSYIFMKRNAEQYAEFDVQRRELSTPTNNITICQGDPNEEIQHICSKDWRSRHAVLFLDPYDMQIEWTTIKAVAKTQAIDLWLLFPLGIGVDCLLANPVDTPKSWRQRLDLLLDTEVWYHEFSEIGADRPLLGNNQQNVVEARAAVIGRHLNKRLKEIFGNAPTKPHILRDSSSNPLYLLCFVAANKPGKVPVLTAARNLLKKID